MTNKPDLISRAEVVIREFKLLFWRLDVELFYDFATKEYGLRQVKRCRFRRRDGWHEYVGKNKSFVIPVKSLKRIIEEAPHFIRKRP